MASEAKRGCGYRKVGGLYLVGEGPSEPCDRLPIILGVCPVCGQGIKFTRGVTWLRPEQFLEGDHRVGTSTLNMNPEQRAAGGKDVPVLCPEDYCPVCRPALLGEKAALMWVGEKFYSVDSFSKEAAELGISKRISALPRGFKAGETWVLLAHKKGVLVPDPDDGDLFGYKPAIFMVWRPRGFERIVKQSEYDTHRELADGFKAAVENGRASMDEENLKAYVAHYASTADQEVFWRLQGDIDQGIKLVPVPDDDKDHQ